MFRSEFSKSNDKPSCGWIFAFVGVVFLAFGIGRVEAAGVKALMAPSPSAAPSGPRVNHRAINRSNIGSRAGGSGRFSIDKSRLGNRKTIKTKRKAAKKPTGKKKKITAKHSPAISNRVKAQAKKKATADAGQDTPQLTELAKEHLPVPRPPQVGGRGTDAFDPDSGSTRNGQSVLVGALTDLSSGNATNNTTPYNEFAEAPTFASESVITHVPGLTLAAWDKFNKIKQGAAQSQLMSPGSFQAEKFGFGDAGHDARPSQDSDDAGLALTGPDGKELEHPAQSGNRNDARGPSHGMSNEEIAAALAEGTLGPGNLGRPRGNGSRSNNRQNNTGSPLTSLLGAVGQKSSNAGTPGSSGPASWVMDNSSDDVSVVSHQINSSNETGQIMSETFEYSNGNTDTIYYGGDGSVVGLKTVFSDGEVIITDYSSSPKPGCEDMSGPGCEDRPIPAALEGIFVDVEAEYDNYKLVAAITREWTGQPAPQESPEGTVDETTLPGSQRPSFQPIDPITGCDSRIASCHEGNSVASRTSNGGNIFQMLGWMPQYAPM